MIDGDQETPLTNRVKVLYVVGSGRSGTTLMDLMLGELDGFFSTGELSSIWNRGLVVDEFRCGCGRRLLDCPLWHSILSTAFPQGFDRDRIVHLQRTLLRERYTLRLLRMQKRDNHPRELTEYARVAERLYTAIAGVTGTSVIVDSSKSPSDAALLPLLPGVDPYFVHLIRDPRATVYSWKRIRDNEEGVAVGKMAMMGPTRNTGRWVLRNVTSETVLRSLPSDRWLRVRYEDFVSTPVEVVHQILDLVGETSDMKRISDSSVELTGNHTVSGNRVRFRTGRLQLRKDDQWVTGQPSRDRRLVSALSLPWILRYDYPVRVPALRSGP